MTLLLQFYDRYRPRTHGSYNGRETMKGGAVFFAAFDGQLAAMTIDDVFDNG